MARLRRGAGAILEADGPGDHLAASAGPAAHPLRRGDHGGDDPRERRRPRLCCGPPVRHRRADGQARRAARHFRGRDDPGHRRLRASGGPSAGPGERRLPRRRDRRGDALPVPHRRGGGRRRRGVCHGFGLAAGVSPFPPRTTEGRSRRRVRAADGGRLRRVAPQALRRGYRRALGPGSSRKSTAAGRSCGGWAAAARSAARSTSPRTPSWRRTATCA